MSSSYKVQFLRNHEIIRAKWDACINHSDNGLIYGHSFILDSICDDWDAIVTDDYSIVMPLPRRSKWGIRYIYQPPFIQRLGIFGNAINNELIETFYNEALKQFPFIHYNTSIHYVPIKGLLTPHQNYLIDLRRNYSLIQDEYSLECLKNIRKAERRGCMFTTDVTVEQTIQMYQSAYGNLHAFLLKSDYSRFGIFLHNAIEIGKAEILGVKDENDDLIYSAAILKDNKRLYYIMGAPTAIGREKRAPYFFIDSLIRKHTESAFVLDFEGSDIPNVAAFYQRFGPTAELYYELKWNNLPRIIRWLKK